MGTLPISLIVHGGAGSWRPGSESDAVASMSAAVLVGRKILESGGSALDAAIASAVALEDNPIFNAGTGAVLNLDGFVEMDACVMVSPGGDFTTTRIGAVTGLQRVKNPIIVAKQVMEETDHVMLTGDGALRFARVMGHVDYDPITADRRADWQDKRAKLENELESQPDATGLPTPRQFKLRSFLKTHPEFAGGTIGVVARDVRGVICAATSTGGYTMKLPGRVGDTPLPGCGTYASIFAGASATGTGEYVIRSLACRQISDNVERGMSIAKAVDTMLDQLGRDFDADVGFIAIDANGVPYGNHRTRDMPHAYFSGASEIVAKMRVEK
jgi:L-asparaginase / beta-aspartyl-peptidase